MDYRCLVGTTWATTTVNGLLKYWVRGRIATPITQSAAIRHVKLIGSTTIVEADGQIHTHGLARTQKILLYDISSALAGGNTKPGNVNIVFSDLLTIGREQNSYFNGRSTGMVFNVPTDFDSSTPVTFAISFYADIDPVNSPFVINISHACLPVGSLMGTSAPTTATHEVTETFDVPWTVENALTIVELSVLLSECRASETDGTIVDMVLFVIEMVDDRGGNMNVVNWSPYYTSWKESGISRT
jgi:hypothetical protein